MELAATAKLVGALGRVPDAFVSTKDETELTVFITVYYTITKTHLNITVLM